MSPTSKIKDKRVLYISYDGLMEPLGESQVLSYLKGLSNSYQIYLLSFEKKQDLKNLHKLKKFKSYCEQNNILWIRLKYHFKFKIISTSYDVILGFLVSFFLIISKKIKLIHVRSTIAGLIAKCLRYFFSFNLIFDMRGFWSQEKADRSGWSRKGILFKFFNRLENNLIVVSDSVITLTKNARDVILSENPVIPEKKFTIIPTCTDLDLFKKKKIRESNEEFILGHIGSVHTAYDINPVLQLYKGLFNKFGHIRLLVINRDSHEYLKTQIEKLDISKENIEVVRAEFLDIPNLIKKIDFGCFFANENLSIKGSMPTKLGEFLACGVPVICNPINLDVSELIQKNKVGIISDFNSSLNLEALYAEMLQLSKSNDTRDNCRNIAESYFSIESGIEKYEKVYRAFF